MPDEERILHKSFSELIKDNSEFKKEFPNFKAMMDIVLPFYGIKMNRPATPRDPIIAWYDGKAIYFYGSHNGGEESLFMAMLGVSIADSGNIQVVKNPHGGAIT